MFVCNRQSELGESLSSLELAEVHFLIGRCQSELCQFHQAHDAYTVAIKHNAKHAEVGISPSAYIYCPTFPGLLQVRPVHKSKLLGIVGAELFYAQPTASKQ